MTAAVLRPEDVAWVDSGTLLETYHEHLWDALCARVADTSAPSAGARRPALAALTVAEAAVRALAVERWPLVRDALLRGATLDDVVAATGLDVLDIRAGLTRWADEMLEHELLDDAGHRQVLALAGGDVQ